MAVEVSPGPYQDMSASLPNPPTPSQEGLCYSRHYAQRIRDMDRNQSKESWIKRIWNHMFVKPKKDELLNDQMNASEKTATIVTFSTSTPESRESKRLTSGRRENGSSKLKDAQHSKSAPPPRLGERSKTLPSELANSPYLPHSDRDKYTILPPPKHKQKNNYYAHDSQLPSSRQKPHSGPTRGAHGAGRPGGPPGLSYRTAPGTYGHLHGNQARKQTHPYLSTHTDTWRPRVTRGYSIIQLEKRAKQIAEKSIKANKVFMCDGPYPMDVYVRMAMRKRGWAEKFGPRVDCMNTSQHTSAKLALSTNQEEDFEVICDQDVPLPWAEENGLYAVVSRIVRHVPSRFIWGGRAAVNNLVTKNEVTVNHFPKARYFSSKAGLTQSLRDLPWLSSEEPLAFFPRCYILGEEEKEDLTDDFRLTACIGVLKCVVSRCGENVPADPSQSTPASDDAPGSVRSDKLGSSDQGDTNVPVFTRTHTVVNIDVSDIEEKPKPEQSIFASDYPPSTRVNGSPGDQAVDESGNDDKSEEHERGDVIGEQKAERQESGKEDELTKQVQNGEGKDSVREVILDKEKDGDGSKDEEKKEEKEGQETPQGCRETETQGGVEVQQGKQTVTKASCEPVHNKPKTYNHFRRVHPVLGKSKRSCAEVPVTAVEWAQRELRRYIRFKRHEDLDSKQAATPKLSSAEWDKLLQWHQQIAHQDGRVQLTETLYKYSKDILKDMSTLWPQYDIDGTRDIWIVKPSDKSKGIGIDFCYKLEDLMKYCTNSTIQGTYVVQKYIESPLLVYNCKFDIRQWFLVTDWNPLTIWFYKTSYLRICSQEYSYDNMHESIHLSNVAIQQHYVNSEKRSSKLPDNNFMTSDAFQQYLKESGAEHAWDEIIYPGMKHALIQTMTATQDITEYRKGAFELYGADFMLSDDYKPWLLEINASPGMAPSSLEKAMLCANVIEDTIKVVLDRRENRHCSTGGYELAYKDNPLPDFRCVDTKFVTEGTKIKRADLQKYAQIDKKQQRLEQHKQKKERERQERELEKKRKAEEKESDQESGKEGETTEQEAKVNDADNNKSETANQPDSDSKPKENIGKRNLEGENRNVQNSPRKRSENSNKLKTDSKSKLDRTLKDSPYSKSLRDNSGKNVNTARASASNKR